MLLHIFKSYIYVLLLTGAYAGSAFEKPGVSSHTEATSSSTHQIASLVSGSHSVGNNQIDPRTAIDGHTAPSTKQAKQKRYTSERAKKNSLDPLHARNQRNRDEAHTRHSAVAQSMMGRHFDTLDLTEKKDLHKTKHYYYGLAYKARQKGDYQRSKELHDFVQELPTPNLVSHRPDKGPLTPDLEQKWKMAQRVKANRERRQANLFMEREFGKPRPFIKKGRKPLDITKLDPQRAQKLARSRAHAARKKENKARKMLLGETSGSANEVTGA